VGVLVVVLLKKIVDSADLRNLLQRMPVACEQARQRRRTRLWKDLRRDRKSGDSSDDAFFWQPRCGYAGDGEEDKEDEEVVWDNVGRGGERMEE
jgi:hypothetical protein